MTACGVPVFLAVGVLGCLLLVLPCRCETTAHEKQLAEGHRRVQGMAEQYDVVHVDTREHLQHADRRRRSVGNADGSYAYPDWAEFSVSAFGQTFHLELERNDVLLPEGYLVRTHASNGELSVDRRVVNCYYQGQVRGLASERGDTSSHAVVSTCNGLSGSFGIGQAGAGTGEETLFIEPLTSQPSANGTHLHAVFKASQAKFKQSHLDSNCGVAESKVDADRMRAGSGVAPKSTSGSNITGMSMAGRRRSRRNVQTSTKYVELLIAVDSTLFSLFQNNQESMSHRVLEVVNFVDAVYKMLRVRVLLVDIEIFNGRNPFTVSSNPKITLPNFLAYRESHLLQNAPRHDNAQLLTGVDFIGNTVGLATVSGMCKKSSSGGVNQYRDQIPTNNIGAIMSHEMGHNFGMSHDEQGCKCRGNCIMAPSLARPIPKMWSHCSQTYLAKFLRKDKGFCLFDVPRVLFGGPNCGNGILEEGEQCDCGTRAECTDDCCDASTCRLARGAQCSSGQCCHNCQYKRSGTVCRSAVNSCDVQETCTGHSGTCPENLFIQNGQPCQSASSSSVCYNGQCNSHTDDCKQYYGSQASSTPQCYDLNRNGISGSNCGLTGAKFTSCTPGHKLCGSIKCTGALALQPQVVTSGSTAWSYREFHVKPRNQLLRCYYFQVTGGDEDGVGYVSDGVVCGEKSVCVNKKCTSLRSLGTRPCPSKHGRTCNGQGKCTNRNTCLCNPGWTGDACGRQQSRQPAQWQPWQAWSSCSPSCGRDRSKQRHRRCGSSHCSGAKTERQRCHSLDCPAAPEDGGWSRWHTTSCSVTCGQGTQRSTRQCNNPQPKNGGRKCVGNNEQVVLCTLSACPTLSPWGKWSTCTVTCGYGIRTRYRRCSVPGGCGNGVKTTQRQTCYPQHCPVKQDGGWSAWSALSPCSVTCGQGTQSRTRQCNRPRPANGGNRCRGERMSTTACSATPSCSILGQWGAWSSCTVTCGYGARTRYRRCSVPGGCGNGVVTTQRQTCHPQHCPVKQDGGWSAWSALSPCSVTCGQGTQSRTRRCNHPRPANGGTSCIGKRKSTIACTATPSCSILGQWEVWSSCTVTCGSGIRTRYRRCSVQRGCSELTKRQTKLCYLPKCQPQVDGGFTTWTNWQGNCDTSPEQTRTRSCTRPPLRNSGAKCKGTDRETRVCPQVSVWGPWRDFGNCSECHKDWRSNFQIRSRLCHDQDAVECTVKLNETRDCKECSGSSTSSALSAGSIIGIIFACLALLPFVAVMIVVVRRRAGQSPVFCSTHAGMDSCHTAGPSQNIRLAVKQLKRLGKKIHLATKRHRVIVHMSDIAATPKLRHHSGGNLYEDERGGQPHQSHYVNQNDMWNDASSTCLATDSDFLQPPDSPKALPHAVE